MNSQPDFFTMIGMMTEKLSKRSTKSKSYSLPDEFLLDARKMALRIDRYIIITITETIKNEHETIIDST
uniref:NR LBD domain-containing protein n=1 Tax=Caenorhabditis tropicalis TaxID=1561998 RepID=A0A1I7TH31_9PELO